MTCSVRTKLLVGDSKQRFRRTRRTFSQVLLDEAWAVVEESPQHLEQMLILQGVLGLIQGLGLWRAESCQQSIVGPLPRADQPPLGCHHSLCKD